MGLTAWRSLMGNYLVLNDKMAISRVPPLLNEQCSTGKMVRMWINRFDLFER